MTLTYKQQIAVALAGNPEFIKAVIKESVFVAEICVPQSINAIIERLDKEKPSE